MKLNSKRQPILVSGSHRSGSTWLGKMIDLSGETGYIHEPFNRASGLSDRLFTKWFTYICDENEHIYKPALERYLYFKYPLLHKIKQADSFRDFGRSMRDFSFFTWNKMMHKRPLMKDPIAIFSAEWLYYTFGMNVIILARHPAAFVGSIKKIGWRTGMNNFLGQPLLMEEHLKSFEHEIKEHAENEKDFVDEGILLWNMIHSVILKYQKKHKDWLFVRHEDLSKNPLQEFGEIYDFLDLEYTDTIREKISRFTTEEESPGKLKRDSKSNVWSWKNRLDDKEIERIKKGTHAISSHFYSEEDWKR